MSYTNTNLTNLGQLKKLAQRTKSELDALDTRVGTLEAVDAEHNVIVGIQKNGTDLTPDANRKVNVVVPTATSEITNDSGFISETSIDEKISAAIAGALIPSGSIAFADLPALTKANCNKLFNITDAFTTTADFVEGAGASYTAGTNVAIINVGTSSSPSYKYDAYTGVIDTSVFMQKQTSATNGNFAAFDANGQAVDSGKKATDFAEAGHTHDDKADKVSNASNGDLAGLGADGNLTDSGVAANNVQQKLSGSTSGDILTAGSTGFMQDSGVALSDVQQKLASGSFTSGNVRTSDANGFAQDGGVALSSLVQGAIATDAEVEEMITEVFGAAN